MSPLAVLLRVLLSLALVLNGSVPVAHAAMAQPPAHATSAMEHASMGHASAIAMNDAGAGGCHDAAPADHAPPSAPVSDDDDGGCCDEDGDCRSTCAQHCAVSIPGVAFLGLSLPPATGPLPMMVAPHPDPHLRDRIRPPIA
jgi:hypothetical protein